ncbi:unnamed protein product [Durusdinium trenchii]|uniref:Uncharacterized protein n=2 Tax=Durusdinium trenchii TaxID=1381693 RepID=A0ABP0R326_9DINO
MGTTWSRGGRKKGPKQNLQKRLSCSMDVVPDMPGELSWGSKQKNRVKSTNSSSSKTSQRSSANSPHRKAVEELPQGIGSELQRATSKMSHSSRGEQSPGRSIIKNSHGLSHLAGSASHRRKSVSFGPEVREEFGQLGDSMAATTELDRQVTEAQIFVHPCAIDN